MSRVRSGVARAALAVVLVATASCARRSDDDDPSAGATPTVPVRVAALETRAFQERIEAPGRWRTADELRVTAPFTAYVDSLRAEVGDVVTPGAVLALLVTQESRAAVTGAEQLVATAGDPAERAEAERALAQARRDLVRVPVRAAEGGTVVRRSAAPGEVVDAGAELLALVTPRSLLFEAHVPPERAAAVSPGEPARIVMEDGASMGARVRRRLPRTSPDDQAALVWLAPDAPPAAGLLDRYGTARIEVGTARRAVATPDSALVQDDLTGAFRIAVVGPGDVAVWTPVRPGLGDDGWHELLPPAPAAGTRVVVTGQRGLPDSTHVAIGS